MPSPIVQWLLSIINNNSIQLSTLQYSTGILMWEVLNRCEKEPYDHLQDSEILKFLTEGGQLERPKYCSDAL